MKIDEIRSAIDLIRDASVKDLAILSLFLLPILLVIWSGLLSSIDYLDPYPGWKFGILVGIAVVYVAGLIAVRWRDPLSEQLKRARLHVKHRLENRPGHRASYEAIREEETNEKYTDDFLKKLIDKYPATFRTVRVKRRGEYKPGITLVKEEPEESGPAA